MKTSGKLYGITERQSIAKRKYHHPEVIFKKQSKMNGCKGNRPLMGTYLLLHVNVK